MNGFGQEDHIRIENLEIYAYHGVFEEEKKKGQKFYLTIDMKQNLRPAGINDDLTKSTHYGLVSELVYKIVSENCYDLIETVAEQCATKILLQFPLIEEITVKVSKPDAPISIPFEDVSVTVTRGWHTAYISYGSNMGDRKAIIENALNELKDNIFCKEFISSSYYETKPYGGVEQDDFINGVCRIKTLLDPMELLVLLHEIENKAGRKREIHWGPRTLDLDIIFYDHIIMETDDLIIPHPDMQNRLFVLEPLSELTKYYIHPVNHCSIAALLASLKVST